ncbi:MAG TPA: bifunctional [glutamine synthetase] adenylyltransferase/[glutamine synthetase]-adenylyl-L-tyrosine phosphorylase [Streptosporangiaceae bacterium]|nr:bifunctional [glutamine synthetase] adenylyltransferase/[glutamine synthetase]-adenylyl-L-tyrosine phosphorylase [Streptosporangiaceae bacterium]
MRRRTTPAGRLARLGFADGARAEQLISEDLALDADGEEGADADLLTAIAGAADPDLALAALARLPRDDGLITALREDPGLRARLMAVLGASAALGDHLARHPGDWQMLAGPGALRAPGPGDLRSELLTAVGANPADASGVARRGSGAGGPPTALRAAYRRRLLHLAARDLTGQISVDETASELADLAAAALEAALAIARSQLPPGSPDVRLAVIAMGKCGGRELNYASDVDVIFVAAKPAGPAGEADRNGAATEAELAALRAATRLAAGMIRVCSQSTAEGWLFPVDPGLRPEGRDGPLVRTLASHRAYYERWAKTWEFQALLKARPVAGDSELGREYLAAMSPMVWQAAQREHFVSDVQAMRRRVIGNLPAAERRRQLKLGPGGLRDIEFAVQLLQLVHGRSDETLREPGTLPALAALARGGYVGRGDAAAMADAYRFLRSLEHLLQLRRLRRTHTLPEDPDALRWLGRALRRARTRGGMVPPSPPSRADPTAELMALWRQHAREARRLHEKLFYRPLLDAVARLPADAARLTVEAARARLEALGYVNPAGALRHIQVLTSGVSRRAAIQRTLLPVMLGWFADAPQPDAGLLAFRQVSEALGESSWYLRLLRDDTTVAWRMARVLASSRYATDLLLRAPEAVAMLGQDAQLAPRPAAALHTEAAAIVARHDGSDNAVSAIRALRRRELLRTAVADVLGRSTVEETSEALTVITAVTISAALEIAIRRFERDAGPLPTLISVVGMGSFGGREPGYGSDADVMFVHDPLPGADDQAASRAAHAVAEETRRLLAQPGPDPALVMDPDLRPEGRQGPLVRTLASYRAYYERWSHPWEAQALLRAQPTAGDRSVGDRFAALSDQLRYPQSGISDTAVREIRRLKARMEAERMPRGMDPGRHLKLGPGGLADVEWVVQLLQLGHAHEVAGLRTTRTLSALQAAAEADLVSEDDAAALESAWRLAARIRNAVVLVQGRPSDLLPVRQAELAEVAQLLGYPPEAPQELTEAFHRAARRARSVMERLFYDD